MAARKAGYSGAKGEIPRPDPMPKGAVKPGSGPLNLWATSVIMVFIAKSYGKVARFAGSGIVCMLIAWKMTNTLQRKIRLETVPVPARRNGGKILVVDDEPPVLRFIELTLRAGGYENLLFSHSGSNVPSLALSERPHLIIMDVMMPGGNGMRALRALKQSPATAGIPVILVSGFNTPTLEDSVQNRADHLLAKPFTAGQLLKVVGQFVNA